MQDNYYQAIDQIKQNRKRYNNIDGIENKLTRFQIYPEQNSPANIKLSLQRTIFRNFCQVRKTFRHENRKITKQPISNVSQ